MSLSRYFPSAGTGPKKGDVVFHVADQDGSNWEKKPMAHVGIVRSSCSRWEPGTIVSVYHMTLAKIEKSGWVIGIEKPTIGCVVNLCGSHDNMSPSKRAKLIDEALNIHNLRSSTTDIAWLYYFGEAKKGEHPAYGKSANLYRFTCASFVEHCYKSVGRSLVSTDSMPEVTDSDRTKFERFLANNTELSNPSRSIQYTPFKRIYPSYLAHAFARNKFPLSGEKWLDLQDHGFFVPLRQIQA